MSTEFIKLDLKTVIIAIGVLVTIVVWGYVVIESWFLERKRLECAARQAWITSAMATLKEFERIQHEEKHSSIETWDKIREARKELAEMRDHYEQIREENLELRKERGKIS